jgi:predicted GNAT family acetyltransferase
MTDAPSDARPTTDPTVVDNPVEHRFEIRVDGELAGFTVYEPTTDSGVLSFVHTEIDERFAGQGLASKLIGAALDAVRSRGQLVLPQCSFVRGFIERRPPYLDLVPADRRSQFDLPVDN